MSDVTTVILVFDSDEDVYDHSNDVIRYTNMEAINDWLSDNDYGRFGNNLRNTGNVTGGSKHVQADVFVAAFNHLDIDEFIAFIKSLKWKYPNNVQLFIKEENDERFTLWNNQH